MFNINQKTAKKSQSGQATKKPTVRDTVRTKRKGATGGY